MLKHNIDLRDWLEREADKQAEQLGPKQVARISAAAQALDHFTEDELEEAARCTS